MFEHMTVGENLMLPSLEKISFWDYIRSSRNIRKMILEENHNLKDVKAEGLGINERIQMTLERWYIFNPMVTEFVRLITILTCHWLVEEV